MGRRGLARAGAALLGAVLGVAVLSGSDQPVTAHPYPRWQELARPPLSPRVDALGVVVGHRVLVLGGRATGPGAGLRDGAAYDVRTGLWHPIATPVALSSRDSAVDAAGSAIFRHRRARGGATWWTYDARDGAWLRMTGVPARASVPTAFHSEVYAVAGRRVVVYSVQLNHWSRLPADRVRPALHGSDVRASLAGTVVVGYAAGRPVADRWDGLRWHRQPAAWPTRPDRGGGRLIRLHLGGSVFLVRGDRAWIRLP